ncbi:MAG: ATP-binding protein [Pseudoalteromonas sp.]|nr:ATP-binding protein [Pseudoalteromonas sp.]
MSLSESERARRLILLLEQALTFHKYTGDGDCPVCGNPSALDAGWSEDTADSLAVLRRETEASTAFHREVEKVDARVRSLLSVPPAILGEVSDLRIDTTAAQSAWKRWSALGEKPLEVFAIELENRALDLASAVEKIQKEAEERHQALEQDWQAVAEEIRAWLPAARRVLANASRLKLLSTAEKRLNEETQAIRNDRFAPIKDRTFRFWGLLRANSSVDISDLALTGTRTRRKVEIDVAVDGTKAAALGVMSQGELHALALSLFLPRATISDSPFGFLFIDDPVQAMDLARVDGLAQVLADVAQTHQVVVFTHDDRLPGAVRRLRINARVLAVERDRNSVVTVQPRLDPVRQHLADAIALAKTDNLSRDVAARVIPGLCRQAIEAACIEVVRRRRLAAGEAHEDVERLLVDNNNLNHLLALLLMDDPKRVQEAKAKLKKLVHPRAREIFDRCNRGAHDGWDGDFLDIVNDVEMVALRIQEM